MSLRGLWKQKKLPLSVFIIDKRHTEADQIRGSTLFNAHSGHKLNSALTCRNAVTGVPAGVYYYFDPVLGDAFLQFLFESPFQPRGLLSDDFSLLTLPVNAFHSNSICFVGLIYHAFTMLSMAIIKKS